MTPATCQCSGVWRGLSVVCSNRGWLGMFPVSIYLATNQTGCHRNADKNVKDGYSWLVRNYRGGEQIYLFGASRS